MSTKTEFTCKAHSYSVGEDRKYLKGQVIVLNYGTALHATLKASGAFRTREIEVPDEQPAEARPEKTASKPLGAPQGEPVELGDVDGLKAATVELLGGAGYKTTADVIAAGVEKLQELEGVGPKTAKDVVEACAKAQTPPAQ